MTSSANPSSATIAIIQYKIQRISIQRKQFFRHTQHPAQTNLEEIFNPSHCNSSGKISSGSFPSTSKEIQRNKI
jgi:hypothetical protein